MPDLTGRIEGEKMGLFGKKKVDFVSPAGGRLMNITEVADPAFSSKMLGDGFAVDLTDGEIGAPFDGEVTAAFPTGHAFGLKRKDGLECLIHVGMDTVQLNGKGFDVLVETGQIVSAGQPVMRLDLPYLKKHAPSLISPVIITELPDGYKLRPVKTGKVKNDEELLVVEKR